MQTAGDEQTGAPPLAAAAVLLALLCGALYGIGDPGDPPVRAALHGANALLVFAIGRALLPTAWAALAGAALFAAHPLQVEAVSLVSQRSAQLAALPTLAALLCYLRGRNAERGAWRAAWWGAAAASWLLALSWREAALALPGAIGLCEWCLSAEAARRRPIAIALCLAAAVVWLELAPALTLHEGLAVVPLPALLNVVHEPIGSPFAALALQMLLLGAAVAGARRNRVASFAVFWFVLFHAVEVAVAPGRFGAEHRNYLALVGPCLAVGHVLHAALPGRLGVSTALALLLVAALGAVTHARYELWRDPVALWEDAVEKSPGSAEARIERGSLLHQQGRFEEALAEFREAVRLRPESARARAQLAASLAGFGQAREALPHVREAVAIDPGDAAAHALLGQIEVRLGDPAAAAAAFERALALAPSPALERRLGDALVAQGRFEDALGHYRVALERDPGDDDARAGAGAALVELGRASDALPYLETAVESEPNPRYLAHLGDALWALGEQASAIDMAQIAVRFAPDWPGATSRLAWMLAATSGADRDPDRALRVADAALEQASGDASLLDARAGALAASGRFEEARADAERAADAAGDSAYGEAIRKRAEGYARREVWREPPRPFEASP